LEADQSDEVTHAVSASFKWAAGMAVGRHRTS